MVMIMFNFLEISRVFTTLTILSCIFSYVSASSPSYCDAPSGFTVINVTSLLDGTPLPIGITLETDKSGYNYFTVDRTLPQYKKVGFCLNGYLDTFDTPKVQTILHKKFEDSVYVSYIDKFVTNVDGNAPICTLTHAYSLYGGDITSALPPFTVRKISDGFLSRLNERKQLSSICSTACGGLVDVVGGNYPKGSDIVPHSESVDKVKFSDVLVKSLTLKCGDHTFYNFDRDQFAYMYLFEHDGAKYAALSRLTPTMIEVAVMCKYGNGVEEKLLYDNDSEFQQAVLKLVPINIFIENTSSMPHGASMTKLDENIDEIAINRFVLRYPYVLLPGLAVDIGKGNADTIWIVKPSEEDSEVKYFVVFGVKGEIDSVDDIKFISAYYVNKENVTVNISNRFILGPNISRASTPVYSHYSKLYPPRYKIDYKFSGVFSPLSYVVAGNSQGSDDVSVEKAVA